MPTTTPLAMNSSEMLNQCPPSLRRVPLRPETGSAAWPFWFSGIGNPPVERLLPRYMLVV